MELASSGARVGCAYFGFIDTDLVRDAFAAPSARLMRQSLPSFVSQPASLSTAVNAIERAIARRSGRVWAPRYVLGAHLGRGLLAPLSERRAMGSPVLDEALELARPATPSPRRTQEPMAAVGEDGRL